MAGIAMESVLSGAIGRQFYAVDGNGQETFLNLWTCLVGEVGAGKTVLFKELLKEFSVEKKLLKEFAKCLDNEIYDTQILMGCANVDAKGKKAAHLKLRNLQKIPRLELTLFDVTAEALAAIVGGAADRFSFCVGSEGETVFANILGRYDRDKKINAKPYLNMFSGEDTDCGRVGRILENESDCLISMLIALKPFEAKELLQNKQLISSGMFSRMLFLDAGFLCDFNGNWLTPRPSNSIFHDCVRKLLENRRKLLQSSAEKIAESLPSLEDFTKASTPLLIDEKAEAIFEELKREGNAILKSCIRSLAPIFAGELARWREIAIKISGICAILNARPTIDKELAEMGANQVRWCKKEFLRKIMENPITKQDERFEKLVYLLENSSTGFLSISELKHKHYFRQDEIDEILRSYGDELHVEDHKPKIGRPSRIISLNSAKDSPFPF
ncbi:MAG: DUF3987 domain-containing protein [Puniceicoccales bacterium]|nr:DUF3987 domain-containing protein [Puniceicoccales bacterium]